MAQSFPTQRQLTALFCPHLYKIFGGQAMISFWEISYKRGRMICNRDPFFLYHGFGHCYEICSFRSSSFQESRVLRPFKLSWKWLFISSYLNTL